MGLHADNLNPRIECLCGDSNDADDTATADGHHDDIQIWDVRKHFHPDCSLAGNDVRVVIWVNEDESLFRGDFVRERFGVANGFAFQDDARQNTASERPW